MRTFACGDVVPGCTARSTAGDDAGVLGRVAGHADADHGRAEVGPKLVAAVRAHIRAA